MQGIYAVLDAVDRLYCDCTRPRCFSCTISCHGLGGTEGMCWFYGPGACIGCHTSIYISDALIYTGNGVYEVIIWFYIRAAPLRRNLRNIRSIIHLTIPHHTYQFAPSTSGRPSPWSNALCSNSLPETRRITQSLTPLTSSKTSRHPSVSVSLSLPSTW